MSNKKMIKKKMIHKNIINNKYNNIFIIDLIDFFEYSFGIDISKYIISFLQPNKISVCSFCCYFIRKKYYICKKCDECICKKCYIMFKNKYIIPHCYSHINYKNIYSNKYIKIIKKRLIKKVKYKIKNKNIKYLQFISKYNNKLYCYIRKYNIHKKTILFPSKKYIKKNYILYIENNTLYIIFIENINDNYFYNLK